MNPAVAQAPAPPDFRAYLQSELVRRCRANPRFSLRAFARLLKIEPSALSKILNGKRSVTRTTFEQLADRLALDPELTEKLRPRALSKKQLAAARAEVRQTDYRQLSLDLFQVISDWYHYALLELTRVEGFQPSPRWVARALGITVSEVNIAVERLERLGFLKIEPDGRWVDVSGSVTTVGNEFTAVAFRKLQRQILEKAIVALEEVPLDSRDQTSITMAASTKMLPVAKERIKQFRRELSKLLQSEGPLDAVFQLGVSLYPVTKDLAVNKLAEKDPQEEGNEMPQ